MHEFGYSGVADANIFAIGRKYFERRMGDENGTPGSVLGVFPQETEFHVPGSRFCDMWPRNDRVSRKKKRKILTI